MQRPHIPFLVFGALFVLSIPFSFDLATSVVPGWHTTTLTPSFLITIGVSIVLLLVTIGYGSLSKRGHTISLALFIVHLLLTIPTVLFIRAPFLFLSLDSSDLELLNRQVTFATALVSASFALFVVGQVLFGIYVFRAIQLSK